jgi:DNA polymerase III subunit delta'
MIYPTYFESRKSIHLFGLFKNFEYLKKLFIDNKLPKVLMLSGKKGSGKSTLLNHLMFFIFDKDNYNEKNCELLTKSTFYYQFVANTFQNIIYLSGSNFKNIKIEDIRNLKTKIFQTTISDKPRFIILDDVELFNNNSLNALLKIIEEPTKNNYFILVDNKSQPLIETIKSRCLEIKIILKEEIKHQIIISLIKKFNIKLSIDPKNSKLTPGNFIKYNHIYEENQISPDDDYFENLSILLNLYKKNKDILFIDMIFFLTDYYFNNSKKNIAFSNNKIVEYKKFFFQNINKFFLYNLNQKALINILHNKINND